MSYETDLIKKITGGMSAIKNKIKTPKEAGLGIFFTKLKEVNQGQYDEKMLEYKKILEDLKK